MNSRTKQDLVEFIDKVEALASAVVLTTGLETAQELIQAAENLKGSLHHDETIIEPR